MSWGVSGDNRLKENFLRRKRIKDKMETAKAG